MEGQTILYLFLSTFISIVVLKMMRDNAKEINFNLIVYSILFIFFAVLMGISLFGVIGVQMGREMRYTIFFSMILNGIGSYYLIDNKRYMRSKVSLISAFLIIIFIISLFNIYPSPIVRSANFQVTTMEFSGINWLIGHCDTQMMIDSMSSDLIRFIKAKNGVTNIEPYKVSASLPHFNYENKTAYGNSFNSDLYHVHLKVYDLLYPEVFREYRHLWKFYENEFYKLEYRDVSSGKIYSNNELKIFYINQLG
jgi:hypothetical protein